MRARNDLELAQRGCDVRRGCEYSSRRSTALQRDRLEQNAAPTTTTPSRSGGVGDCPRGLRSAPITPVGSRRAGRSHHLAKNGVVENEITLSAVKYGIEPASYRDALAAGRQRTVRPPSHVHRARPGSQHYANKRGVLMEGELRHEPRAAVDAPGMQHFAERSSDSDRATDKPFRTCAELIQFEHACRLASGRRDRRRFRVARDSSGTRRTAREQRDCDEFSPSARVRHDHLLSGFSLLLPT